MNVHRIRLRAAWQRQLGQQRWTVDLPDEVPLGDAFDVRVDDRLIYTRTFNCPTGLDLTTRVLLVIERWHGSLAVTLDDRVLAEGLTGPPLPWRADVTSQLKHSHRLQLQLAPRADGLQTEASETEPRLTGQVFLEIIEDASQG